MMKAVVVSSIVLVATPFLIDAFVLSPLNGHTKHSSIEQQKCLKALVQISNKASFAFVSTKLYSSKSSSSNEALRIPSNNDNDLKSLFDDFCDNQGMMTFTTLKTVPFFGEILEEGDLGEDELMEFWMVASNDSNVSNSKIDFNGFCQLYQSVDNLFEEYDSSLMGTDKSKLDDDKPSVLAIFAELCDDKGLVSKEKLLQWDEITQLFDDGLLGQDEFESMWNKVMGENEEMNAIQFLDFNAILDELFVIEEEEEEDILAITGEDSSPEEIFRKLADKNSLVGFEELQKWGELKQVLDDGELLMDELQLMFYAVPKAPGSADKIDMDGFLSLYYAIDSLFEEFGDGEVSLNSTPKSQTRQKLLEVLEKFAPENFDSSDNDDENEKELPCGLTCDEKTEATIMDLVTKLEAESTNLVRSSGVSLSETDLAGEWDLMFTNSGMMKFNKGLSGLGGSFPNGRFGGLKQKLTSTKYLTDVEYVERIEVNPEISSFDVKISGDWVLKRSVSLLTGDPTVLLSVEPDKVVYGPTSTRADHWKSVRAMNLLDVTYLDEDLRIMRGNTSTNTIFVFKRV